MNRASSVSIHDASIARLSREPTSADGLATRHTSPMVSRAYASPSVVSAASIAAPSMVSQAYAPSERTLTIRRAPPSISSRSTTTTATRRHRTSSRRSHAGGGGGSSSSSHYLPQNEFPIFSQTGDVEILVAIDGQDRRYLLHRLILAQCSGFFDASTSEPSSQQPVPRPEDAAQSTPARQTWRYELDLGSAGVPANEVPMLVQKPLSSGLFGGDRADRPPPIRNKPPAPSNGVFRSISAMQSAIHIPHSANHHRPQSDTIRDYDNLFRIFYNYPPDLDAVDITEAYIQCKTLLTLADLYDALEVVGPRIDHHLLQFQSRLWKQIAKYPPSYLKLGYLARSRVIFAEALIHIVGQWPQGASQLRHTPDAVRELIEDKVADLDDLKARIEGRLFRLSLTTSRGERVTPYNSLTEWSVIAFFRQWLADHLYVAPPPSPSKVLHGEQPALAGTKIPSSIATGRVFRQLGAGGSAYLDRDELKRFLKLRPDEYSRDTLRRCERRLEELKAQAREVVRPLMRSHLQLEGTGAHAALGYLTCTRLDEVEHPW